jgi:hypothetical protein
LFLEREKTGVRSIFYLFRGQPVLVEVVLERLLHLHSPFLHPQGNLHLHSPFLHPQGILHSHFPAGHLQGVLLTFLQAHFPAGHLQAFLQVHLPAGHLQAVLAVLQVHFPAGHLQGVLAAHLPSFLQAALSVLQQVPAFGQPFFRLHCPAALVLEQAASLSSHPTTKIKPINTNIVIVRFIIVLQKSFVTQQGHAFIIGYFVK